MSVFDIRDSDRLKREFLAIAEEMENRGTALEVENIKSWMTRLHGPKVLKEGVLFAFEAPNAKKVCITGEFNNWSGEGICMELDPKDGLWKTTLDLEPGEYEYRFIVDGVWLRDPRNSDTVMNEFGQENSLLIV
jgi:1,4-alpha-glucan branching enzyme